jgi:hypothetical protein
VVRGSRPVLSRSAFPTRGGLQSCHFGVPLNQGLIKQQTPNLELSGENEKIAFTAMVPRRSRDGLRGCGVYFAPATELGSVERATDSRFPTSPLTDDFGIALPLIW